MAINATLDNALLQVEVEAMGHSEIHAIVTATHPSTGSSKQVLPKTLFDESQVRKAVSNAFTMFPDREVSLQIDVKNGSRTKPKTIFNIQKPSFMDSYNTLQTSDSRPSFEPKREHASAPGVDQLSRYIISEKERQLDEKNEVIRDYRDQLKIQEATIRDLQNSNQKLREDLSMKDREQALDRREFEANNKSGLAGVQDFIKGLPDGVLETVGAKIVERLIPAPAPAPQMTGIPQGNLSQEEQEVVVELHKLYPHLGVQKLSELYGIAHFAIQGQLNLTEILNTVNNGANI